MRAHRLGVALASTPLLPSTLALASTLVLALSLVGCGGASADPGLAADLQVAGAAFAPGALPAGAAGPSVRQLALADARIAAGAHDLPLLGQLDTAATAVALTLDRDLGYWIVGAGVPASDAPTLPTFDVRLAFAARLASGPRQLIAEAADANGRFGPPSSLALDIAGASLPAGPLVVHLEWRGAADLDLHVVDAAGVEIWARHPSGYRAPPPPALPDPTAAAKAALLDVDSNGGCVLDGRDQENVVWKEAPASGHYVVRVDAASLCGAPLADWRVEALLDGSVAQTASGEAVDADTRGPHDQGAGRTALELDVP